MIRAFQDRRNRGGVSLLEIAIAAVILSGLLTLVFLIFRSGILSLRKVENQSTLVRELQLLSLKVSEEVRHSNYFSMGTSTDGTMLSFLSAVDSSDTFHLDAYGRPEWQKFIVYYHDDSAQTVMRLTEAYATATPTDARTLEEYSGGPLTDFVGQNNPQPVSHNVSRCLWEIESSTLLKFEFETEKTRYQSTDKEKKGISGRIYLRN